MKSRLLLENIKLSIHTQWPLAANLKTFDIASVGMYSKCICVCACVPACVCVCVTIDVQGPDVQN